MKIFKIPVLFLLLAFAAQSCKKKSSNTNPSWSNFEINDSAWISGVGHSTIIGDSLLILNFSAGYYIEEEDFFNVRSKIRLYSIPLKLGNHRLNEVPINKLGEEALSGKPFALFSTLIEAGEFFCTDYKVYADDSLNNWLEIERQEDNYRKVWGSYSITMIKDTSMLDGTCTRNTYGDTVRIRNAKFYAETY